MRFFLDTNIIIIYLRNDKTRMFIDEKFAPFTSPNIPIISVVTIGEIRSIGIRNKWGKQKLISVELLYNNCLIIGINKKPIINAYGNIDSYSQGKLEDRPLIGSSRNMGKNDLWIAATAIVSGAKLLTLDNDFEHLNGVFLDAEIIERVK